MFVGHFGLGFAGKSQAPRVSLGTLFLAAQFVDLLWPVLLLLGLESVAIAPGATSMTPLEFSHYPISHSLLTAVGWGLAFGAVFYALRRSRVGAMICGVLVVSHWLLDLVTHKPDLPLTPGLGAKVGLGLWNHPMLAIPLELALLGIGVLLYVRATRARDRVGGLGLWSLVVFLLLVYAANLLGEPPPSSEAIAWVGHAQWILIAWGFWLDRHREPVATGTEG